MSRETTILSIIFFATFLLNIDFASAATTRQTTQVRETVSSVKVVSPEKTSQESVGTLIPFPSETKPVSNETKNLSTEPAEAVPTTTNVSEIEIRPTDGVMMVFTENGSVPTETSLVGQSEARELVKVTSEQAMPSSITAVVQSPDGSLKIGTQEVSASTFLPIRLTGESLRVEVGEKWETVILPSMVETLVKGTSSSRTEIKRMDLVECKPTAGPAQECGATYEVEAERETKLFGIIGIKSTIQYEVSASSGQITKEEKPWYLKTLPFLFR